MAVEPLGSNEKLLMKCEPGLKVVARSLSERPMVPDVNRQSSRHHDFTGGMEDI